MDEPPPPIPPGSKTLFVRPPQVEQMRDPLYADWNMAAGIDPATIIDFSPLNAIFENFLAVVGLPVAIIDLQGKVLASSRWQRLCMDFHRVAPGTLARCRESDTTLTQSLAEGSAFTLYRCRNGLTDCATPILVEDIHVANLFIGQFLLTPPDKDFFQRQQEEFGFDSQAYDEALAEIPIVSEDRVPAILHLMRGLAQQIAQQSVAEHRVRLAYDAVERQVAERTRELAESHERLRKIADRIPGVVYQFAQKADGHFCAPYVSDAFSEMFSAAPEDVRDDAAKIFDAALPEDLDALLAAIHVSAATLAPWHHEFRIRKPDGTLRWLAGEALPQREPDGSILWHGFITDTTERKRTEVLLKARLRLGDLSAKHSLHDLLVATLDEVCALTGAETGFYHFMLPDQKTLSLQAWSTKTTQHYCRANKDVRHYDLDAAGVWADAVRLRRSVIYNDYASLAERRGLPDGHAPVFRLMSVPILRDDRIVAIIGVGNKRIAFDEDDLNVVETLADLAWDLADRKRAEEALAERNTLVQRRYDSLRALNEIASLPPGAVEDQLAQSLALGAQHLGLSFAILARIEGDRYTIVNHSAPPESGLVNGQELVLGDTYCALTLRADDVVAIPHVGASDHAGHPCHRISGLEAYIAAPVRVGNRLFGTVNFSSPTPYPRDFDEGDLEFMRLLARWVGSVLERQKAEADVVAAKEAAEERARELASSNSELEQFAYVASHDMRQPLRMVNSYLTLIERRFAAKLDDDGREFIGFARDGALQMDRLILDLLEYSRVGRHGEASQAVDLADAAAEGARHFGVLVEETRAILSVKTATAPVIGNRSELTRLFQNLIGNALKYRSPDRAPHIAVDWRRDGEDWIVSVADNGIGIAPEYLQDIFKIFRRLHTSHEYEGTGIGLAVCQKIVKHHGGRIWIESEPGVGSTFFFTIPDKVHDTPSC